MNIAPKFLDITTSPSADRSEERPEADEDSVKDFLLDVDEPIKPERYVALGLKGESADQDFLHALSINLPETPLPPLGNIASTDLVTASISEHLISEATSLQTAPLTEPIDVDETILPARAMRADSSVRPAEILPARSPIASTDIPINSRPSATHIEPVEGKTPTHPPIAIDETTGAPAKDSLIFETPAHGSVADDLLADEAKDQTRFPVNATVKDAAAKLDNPQHKVMIETATPKEARPAAPISGDTGDEMRIVKAETIAIPIEKLTRAVDASSNVIARAKVPEHPKTLQNSPEFAAEKIVKPERAAITERAAISEKAAMPERAATPERAAIPEKAAIKDTPLSLPPSKNAEIAPSLVADVPKFIGDITPVLTPLGNPISEGAVKAPQAVTIIATPTSTSHPALQTVAQTLVKAQETQSGISVRLDPPEMGRVFIDFKFDADRNVTAIIRSEITETAILLRDKAEFFQQTLKDNGFNSINLSFEQNDQSKQNAFDHDYTGKAPALFHAEQSDDDALQTASPPSHRYKLSADTAIDIKL